MALISSPTQGDVQTLLTAYHQRLRRSRRSRVGAGVAVAVGLWWLLLAAAHYFDWLPVVLLPGVVGTAVLVGVAVWLDLRRRPALADTARLLDARLDDRQRLTTAVELLVADPEAAGPLAGAQLTSSAALLGRADPGAIVPVRAPWPALVISAGLLLLALGLFVLKLGPPAAWLPGALPSDAQGLAALPTPTADPGLPGSDQAPPGGQPSAGDGGQDQQQLGPGTDPVTAAQQAASREAQAALDRLAAALGEQSVTQAAADSLRQGQYDQAANQITDVGKQSDQLSDAAKQGLAAALNRAAQDTPSPPELQKAEQAAATALQGGDYGRIADAMKALGDAVRQVGDRVITQPDLAKSYPDQSGQAGTGAQAGQDAAGAQNGQQSAGSPPGNSGSPNGAGDNPGSTPGAGGEQSGAGDQAGQGSATSGDSPAQNGAGGTGGSGAGGTDPSSGAAGTDGGSGAAGNPDASSRVSGPDETAPLDVAGTPFELQGQPDANRTGPPDPNQPPGLSVEGDGGTSSGTTPLAPGSPGSAPSESNQLPVNRWEPVQRYFSHDETK